jgi:hypothetical protein
MTLIADYDDGTANLYTTPLIHTFEPDKDTIFTVLVFLNGLHTSGGTYKIILQFANTADSTTYGDEAFQFPSDSSGLQRLRIDQPLFLPANKKVKIRLSSTNWNDTSVGYRLWIIDPQRPTLDSQPGDIDGKTVLEALRAIAAVLCGKADGAGEAVETFKGLNGTTDRVEVTVDTVGNRTGVDYL